MEMKSIKLLFYALFGIDILAGAVVAYKLNIAAGIITAFVLLVLNAVCYIVILKLEKKSNGKK